MGFANAAEYRDKVSDGWIRANIVKEIGTRSHRSHIHLRANVAYRILVSGLGKES